MLTYRHFISNHQYILKAFTGMITDSAGRKRYYVNGKPVKHETYVGGGHKEHAHTHEQSIRTAVGALSGRASKGTSHADLTQLAEHLNNISGADLKKLRAKYGVSAEKNPSKEKLVSALLDHVRGGGPAVDVRKFKEQFGIAPPKEAMDSKAGRAKVNDLLARAQKGEDVLDEVKKLKDYDAGLDFGMDAMDEGKTAPTKRESDPETKKDKVTAEAEARNRWDKGQRTEDEAKGKEDPRSLASVGSLEQAKIEDQKKQEEMRKGSDKGQEIAKPDETRTTWDQGAKAAGAGKTTLPNGEPIEPGQTIHLAGGQYVFEGMADNGNYKIKNQGGDVWEETASNMKGAKAGEKPTEKPSENLSHQMTRDAFYTDEINHRIAETHKRLWKIRTDILHYIKDTNRKLPAGITPEQYLLAYVSETKRPNERARGLAWALNRENSHLEKLQNDLKLTASHAKIGTNRYTIDMVHRNLVTAALAAGKPVPSEVLADYPDLAGKAAAPQPPEPGFTGKADNGVYYINGVAQKAPGESTGIPVASEPDASKNIDEQKEPWQMTRDEAMKAGVSAGTWVNQVMEAWKNEKLPESSPEYKDAVQYIDPTLRNNYERAQKYMGKKVSTDDGDIYTFDHLSNDGTHFVLKDKNGKEVSKLPESIGPEDWATRIAVHRASNNPFQVPYEAGAKQIAQQVLSNDRTISDAMKELGVSIGTPGGKSLRKSVMDWVDRLKKETPAAPKPEPSPELQKARERFLEKNKGQV